MPFGGLTMAEALGSRRRDFSDLGAAPKVVTFKRGSSIKGRAKAGAGTAEIRPWYKKPVNYVFAAFAAVLIFAPSLLTHGGRARTPRPFGRA
jgi:hypothetical protein